MRNTYDPDQYGKYLCLKVPFWMLAVLFFTCRHLVFVLLANAPLPSANTSMGFLTAQTSLWFLLTDLPALLVLLAWGHRLPNAKPVWEWLWRRGRELISISLVFQMGFTLMVMIAGQSAGGFSWGISDRLLMVNVGLIGLSLYYFWRFSIVADVFEDFPKTDQIDKTY